MIMKKHAFDKLKLVETFILSNYNDSNLIDIELNRYDKCATINLTLSTGQNTGISIGYNDLNNIIINHNNKNMTVNYFDIVDVLTKKDNLLDSLNSLQ